MSDLRKQLQAARQEYRQQHYQGDLAADVLRKAWQPGRWTAAVGAIAAMLVVAVYLYRQAGDSPAPQNEIVVQVPSEEIETTLGTVPVMSVSDVSLELSPPAYEFSIGVPSFSLSSDDTSDQESASEKEAV